MSLPILRCYVALILVLSMVGCSGQGTLFSGDGGASGDALSDLISDPDASGADGLEGPDRDGPWDGTDDTPTFDAVQDQVESDLAVGDAGGVDLVEDQGGEDSVEPGDPWAPCSAGNPCSSPQICLLLPGSDTDGICVVSCAPGGEDCPPSQDCVAPDPDTAPEVGYCFLPAGHLEPCDVKSGKICAGGRYCLAPMAGGTAVCTDFCIPDEALCPDLTECGPVSEEGVTEGWGACLPVAEAAPCAGDLECSNSEVCVVPTLGVTPSLCLAACDNPGVACASGGICTLLEGPGGTSGACLHQQDAGEWCNPFAGWVCDSGRVCLDVNDPTGFGRCAAPCIQDAECAAHEVCAGGLSTDGAFALGCLPPSMTGPPNVPCNDSWPCTEDAGVCVEGACTPPCGAGCPEDLVCIKGGCVHAALDGHGCAPGWGWLCVEGAACSSDQGADSGICSTTCVGDDDCAPGQACLPGPVGDPICLAPVPFGGECAFSTGTGCADAGHCMFLGSGATGFCTAACPGIGQGGCPAGPPGTMADCMLNSGGQTWCAFLCGPFGSDCPDGMTCDASGVCLP